MTTGNVGIAEAASPDKYVATYTITEDVLTKLLQRVALSGSDGADIGGTASAAAWSSGDGTIISLLKAMATQAVSTNPVSVVGAMQWVQATLTTDGTTNASGDVLFDSIALTNAARAADSLGILQSIMLYDQDDLGSVPLDIYLFSANRSLGTKNAAPTISAANSVDICAIIPVSASDWKDVGAAKVACLSNLGRMVKPASGTATIYAAGIAGGSWAATGVSKLVASFGFIG